MGSEDYEPSDLDLARMRREDLLARLAGAQTCGDYEDPASDLGVLREQMQRKFRFIEYDDESDELLLVGFAAALFMAGLRLGRRVLWPTALDAELALLLLLMLAARCDGEPHLTPGGDDLFRIPSAPLPRAHAVLTCAPPARVPCPAGTAG
jgi:hypothetical protein